MHRWLAAGHTVAEVEKGTDDARKSFFTTEVAEQDFRGLTGRVRHFPSGDRDGQIQLFQLQGGKIHTLGSVVNETTVLWEEGVPIVWRC